VVGAGADSLKNDPIWQFKAYPKALLLYDLAWEDTDKLLQDVRGCELIGQLIGSAGSVSANIDEGFGRGIEDFVEKRRALGRSPTPKHRSPELVRGVPTWASVCRREAPQQVGDSHRTSIFQQSHRRWGVYPVFALCPGFCSRDSKLVLQGAQAAHCRSCPTPHRSV